MGLGGTKASDSSIVFRTFRGGIKLITRRIKVSFHPLIYKGCFLILAKRGVEVSAPVETNVGPSHTCIPILSSAAVVSLLFQVPFSLLTLDLPPAPLFKDEQEKNIIPQV